MSFNNDLGQKSSSPLFESENNDAKYIIDNYRHWHGISKKQFHISEDFKIYKEIFVGKQKIISIYKRI